MALLQTAGGDLATHLKGIADGAQFMLASALALAAVLATVLAVALCTARQAVIASIVFIVAAAASAWMPRPFSAEALVAGLLFLLGVVIASGLRLHGGLAGVGLVLGGSAAGLAGGLQTATWEETLGGLLVLVLPALVGLVLAARVEVPRRLQRGLATARRMAGAWIAAVGMLLLALWLRSGAG